MLITYFSVTGTTKQIGSYAADILNADLYEIVPEIPYADVDLDWNNAKSYSSIEMKDTSSRSAIAGTVTNVEQYGTVFVGFSIWWYIAPTIINTFLESYDFRGKARIPFATSAGSGLGNTEENLHKSASNANWLPDKLLSGRISGEEADMWFKELKLV